MGHLFSILLLFLFTSCSQKMFNIQSSYSLCEDFRKTKEFKCVENELGEKVKDMIMVGSRRDDLPSLLLNSKANHYIIFAMDLLTEDARDSIGKKNLIETITLLKKNGFKMIAVDNEGGAVNRLSLISNFARVPAANYMKYLPEAELISVLEDSVKQMSEIGINVNFTPIVDLAINTDPNFFLNWKKRMIAENPKTVADIATKVVDAHRKYGIKTSLKHFPGHGSASVDTHEGFADISKSWSEKELIPYKRLIRDDKVDSIMIGHIFNKNLDDKFPAVMSKKIINDLLRKRLKYDGVIFSDSLDMSALKQYSLEDVIINAVNAGNDVLIYANQISYDSKISEKIYNIIIQAILDGKIPKERILESSARVQKFLNNNQRNINAK